MRPAILAFICAAILPQTAFAQSEIRSDPYGSRGDTGTDLRCSSGSFIVGMAGASGTNIDRIQIVCAKIAPDGFALPSSESSIVVGGSGGGAQSQSCPTRTYIDKFEVFLTLNKDQVYFLYVNCASPNGSDYAFSFGPDHVGTQVLRDGNPYRFFACPPNMAVSGLTVRHGKHINAVGAICTTIVRQPAPPPVVVTPPPPARTGRVVPYGAPKSGAVVKYPAFTGRYELHSRSGITATLILNAGDADDYFGTISSPDPRYNGTVLAKGGNGRRFTLTWKGPAGQTGSGTLGYNGYLNDALIGGLVSDGPPRFSEIWGGKRQ